MTKIVGANYAGFRSEGLNLYNYAVEIIKCLHALVTVKYVYISLHTTCIKYNSQLPQSWKKHTRKYIASSRNYDM